MINNSGLVKTISSGYLSRATTFLTVLVLPLLISSSMGVEKLGVLMTLLSFHSILAIADLGISNHSLNEISRIKINQQEKKIKILKDSLALIIIISFFIMLAGAMTLLVPNAEKVFSVSDEGLLKEGVNALALFISIYGLSLIPLFIYKIQFSFNEGYIANIFQTFASLLNFSIAYFCVVAITTNLEIVILSVSIGSIILGFLNSFLFLKKRMKFSSFWSNADIHNLFLVMKGSTPFLILQLIFILTYAMDTGILAYKLGVEAVPAYSWFDRLFSIVTVSASIIITPLWVLYANKIGEGEKHEAYKLLKKYTLRLLGLTAFTLIILLLVIYFITPELDKKWLVIDDSLIISLSIWKICEVFGMALVVFMHSLGLTKNIMYMGILTAITSLFFKLFLIDDFGPSILPISTAVCYVTFCILPMLYLINKTLDNNN